MPLAPETVQEISAIVRSGFEDRDRIVEIFCEEMYEPGDLVPEEVEAAVDDAIARREAEKETWPEVTDCDRLDTAFEAMNQRGIVALQNAGYTQSDGHSDCSEAYHELSAKEKSRVIGYCFYHGQDLERAVAGEGLFLAFGPIDPKGEETKGPEVGCIIVEELERAGFEVDWEGTFGKRIFVPKLDWKKR